MQNYAAKSSFLHHWRGFEIRLISGYINILCGIMTEYFVLSTQLVINDGRESKS